MQLKAIAAFVASLFTPTVDGALSSFKRAVRKLEKVAKHHEAKARKASNEIDAVKRAAATKIDALAITRRAAYLETDRATAVASKIADVFGVTLEQE